MRDFSKRGRSFRQSFQLYAEGRIQTIEGTDFSFGVGATLEEAQAAFQEVKKANARNESPEWLRKIVANAGRGQAW